VYIKLGLNSFKCEKIVLKTKIEFFGFTCPLVTHFGFTCPLVTHFGFCFSGSDLASFHELVSNEKNHLVKHKKQFHKQIWCMRPLVVGLRHLSSLLPTLDLCMFRIMIAFILCFTID